MDLSGGQTAWLAWAWTGVATAAAVYGVWRGLRARARADGRVVRVSEGQEAGPDGVRWCDITVVFRVGGREHRVEGPARGWWWLRRPREGQAVRVYFPPGRPDRATLDRWGLAPWGLPLAA